MSEMRPPEPEDEFEAEVTSLEATPWVASLAVTRAEEGAPQHALPFLAARLSLCARLARAATTLLVLTLAVALLLSVLPLGASLRAYLAGRPRPPLALGSPGDGISCLVDAAWSPDSRHIALFGYADDRYCPYNNLLSMPSALVIYNATTGARLALSHPDAPISAAISRYVAQLPAPPPAAGGPLPALTLQYRHVLWSPDGKTLALSFSAEGRPIPAMERNVPLRLDGVALLDRNGRFERVLLTLDNAFGDFHLRWDLQQNRPAPPFGDGQQVPAALAYRWGVDDTLRSEQPLEGGPPLPASIRGAIGQPDGGVRFSIWQRGVITPLIRDDGNVFEQLHGIYTYTGSVLSWSPDGRYLLDAVTVTGLLETAEHPPLTPQLRSAFQVMQLPVLPVRDAALAQLLRQVGPVMSGRGIALAWRPDGRILAAFDSSNTAGPVVDLYDCATGRRLVALQPASERSLTGVSDLLSWSPDGSRLLLFDVTAGTITVWSGSQLPG